MRYFITGATGFLGRHVARQLRQSGHEVTALVRSLDAGEGLASLGVALARGDVTDRETMRGPMAAAEAVFHVAGWYKVGVRDRRPGAAINIDGTRNVLELMKELGIPKGVYTSTLAINSDTGGRLVDETYRFTGRHLSEYDRTKSAAHEIALRLTEEGLPLVIVQPGVTYGPGDGGPSHDLFVNYLKRRLPLIPQRTAYSWAHVDDVARGHILAMERGRIGQSYLICGAAHTLIDVLKLAERLTGVPAPSLTAPPWTLKAISGIMGVVERVVPVPDNYSSEYLRVTAGATYIADNSKARRELDWVPRPIEEGLPETLHDEMKSLGME